MCRKKVFFHCNYPLIVTKNYMYCNLSFFCNSAICSCCQCSSSIWNDKCKLWFVINLRPHMRYCNLVFCLSICLSVSLSVCLCMNKISGQLTTLGLWSSYQKTWNYTKIKIKDRLFLKPFGYKVMSMFTTRDCHFTTFRRLLEVNEQIET